MALDGDLITWEPEAGAEAYDLYRGDLGSQALLPFAACVPADVPSPYFVDPDLPVPGEGFFYLVSAVVSGISGPLGFTSDGIERSVDTACE